MKKIALTLISTIFLNISFGQSFTDHLSRSYLGGGFSSYLGEYTYFSNYGKESDPEWEKLSESFFSVAPIITGGTNFPLFKLSSQSSIGINPALSFGFTKTVFSPVLVLEAPLFLTYKSGLEAVWIGGNDFGFGMGAGIQANALLIGNFTSIYPAPVAMIEAGFNTEMYGPIKIRLIGQLLPYTSDYKTSIGSEIPKENLQYFGLHFLRIFNY